MYVFLNMHELMCMAYLEWAFFLKSADSV